ncbi:MAG: hypothetical protein HYX51_07830 [Chloroflexi bacterium]|nr:hypothetical protein [Chloroflexota bacterium]
MTPDNRISLRSWLFVAVTGIGLFAAVAAVVLTAYTRADHNAAVRLSSDDLVLSESVAETRTLVMELRLSVMTAALDPGSDAAERYRSAHRRVTDELRRARLHSSGQNTVDVADDLENSLVRLSAAADRVFAAASEGDSAALQPLALAAEKESAQARELAEELTTIATTVARERATGITNTSRPRGLAILAIVALILAVEGGVLAWASAGPALVRLVTGKPIPATAAQAVEATDDLDGTEDQSAESDDAYNLTQFPTGTRSGANADGQPDERTKDASFQSASGDATSEAA